MLFEHLASAATFICGHPKSGTSLLQALLDFHPQLIVYPEETRFFRDFMPHFRHANYDQAAAEAEEFLLHIFRWNEQTADPTQVGYEDRDYSALSFTEVRRIFREVVSNLPQEFSQLLPAAFLAYAEASGQLKDRSKRWVEKTPFNESFASVIFELWPDARCVHLTRDPRDNYASYRRKHPAWSPEIFAYSWRKSARLGRDNERRYGTHRYMVLRYEDLVNDLDQEIGKVAAFLEIDDHSRLRTPSRAGAPWKGNSMFGDSFNAVSTRPVGRWKSELDPASVSKLEVLLREEMQQEDYSFGEKPTWKDQVWKARLRAAWWVKEAIGS